MLSQGTLFRSLKAFRLSSRNPLNASWATNKGVNNTAVTQNWRSILESSSPWLVEMHWPEWPGESLQKKHFWLLSAIVTFSELCQKSDFVITFYWDPLLHWTGSENVRRGCLWFIYLSVREKQVFQTPQFTHLSFTVKADLHFPSHPAGVCRGILNTQETFFFFFFNFKSTLSQLGFQCHEYFRRTLR